MTYVADQARQELLDSVADAAEALGRSLAALGAAYEQLDDHSAERMEELLFRPLQAAYGQAQRAHSGFAARHNFELRVFSAPAPGSGARGGRVLLGRAVDDAEDAEHILVELQDSLAPVEVGDPELRAGLAELRETLAGTRERADDLLRSLGR